MSELNPQSLLYFQPAHSSSQPKGEISQQHNNALDPSWVDPSKVVEGSVVESQILEQQLTDSEGVDGSPSQEGLIVITGASPASSPNAESAATPSIPSAEAAENGGRLRRAVEMGAMAVGAVAGIPFRTHSRFWFQRGKNQASQAELQQLRIESVIQEYEGRLGESVQSYNNLLATITNDQIPQRMQQLGRLSENDPQLKQWVTSELPAKAQKIEIAMREQAIDVQDHMDLMCHSCMQATPDGGPALLSPGDRTIVTSIARIIQQHGATQNSLYLAQLSQSENKQLVQHALHATLLTYVRNMAGRTDHKTVDATLNNFKRDFGLSDEVVGSINAALDVVQLDQVTNFQRSRLTEEGYGTNQDGRLIKDGRSTRQLLGLPPANQLGSIGSFNSRESALAIGLVLDSTILRQVADVFNGRVAFSGIIRSQIIDALLASASDETAAVVRKYLRHA